MSIADLGVDYLGVVVVDVLAEETPQVIPAEHDDMVQELTSRSSHEALCCPVLPATCPVGVGQEPVSGTREGRTE
jgi:hypothetical protein